MGVKSYLRSNWMGLLGLIGTVVGLLLSWYFYEASLADRRPRFLIDPTRTTLVDPSNLRESPIRVVRTDAEGGGEIQGSLTSVRVYFWNEGKLPIRRENVLEMVRIRLGGEKNQLVDSRVVNEPRSVVKAVVRRTPGDLRRTVDIDFERLEEGDGLAIQVLWEGSPQAAISVEGTIEGPAPIRQPTPAVFAKLWKAVSGPLMSLVCVVCFVTLHQAFERYKRRIEVTKNGYGRSFVRVGQAVGAILSLTILVGLSLFLIGIVWFAGREALVPGPETVPEAIKQPGSAK